MYPNRNYPINLLLLNPSLLMHELHPYRLLYRISYHIIIFSKPSIIINKSYMILKIKVYFILINSKHFKNVHCSDTIECINNFLDQ